MSGELSRPGRNLRLLQLPEDRFDCALNLRRELYAFFELQVAGIDVGPGAGGVSDGVTGGIQRPAGCVNPGLREGGRP
jgi:hypothetical protein